MMSQSKSNVWTLAFETSGAVGGVALGSPSGVLKSVMLSGPRRHAVEFVDAVARICKRLDVSPAAIRKILVSAGPGSFTGLRIGVSVARSMALVGDVRLVPVPTLTVIAQNALQAPQQPRRVAVLLDAKRQHAYAAAFIREGDYYRQLSAPAEVTPSAFLMEQVECDPQCVVIGEGAERYRSSVEAAGLRVLDPPFHQPKPETVYRLGMDPVNKIDPVEPRDFVPFYIRPPEAQEKWELRHTKP